MSKVVLGSALAVTLMAGASLAQSQTREKLPWATGAEPSKPAEAMPTQTAAVDTKHAVPPLPIRNAAFAAKEAEAKAKTPGTSAGDSDVTRAFRQGDSQ